MTESPQIAWRAIRYGAPVLSKAGATIGTVREVLGSDQEDIFHGVRVGIDRRATDDFVVTPDHITSITEAAISTDLTSDQAKQLPRYTEASTYHLASVGWLRRHLGWSRDASSDEEPG